MLEIFDSTSPRFEWLFPASVSKVIDGDTLDMILDTGMHTTRRERCRLLGVDTPELRGEAAVDGEAARLWVIQWVQWGVEETPQWPFLVKTVKDPDAFGRYLVVVYRRFDSACLNQDLVTSGHAVVR